MPATVRIATFNCENLFARYNFRSRGKLSTISKRGWDVNETKFTVLNKNEKKLTGEAIKKTKADIIALQEVENIEVLRRFRTDHLGGFRKYPHVMLVDGNDPRHIDVAVLSRYPIVHARSYQHVKKSGARAFTFSRDCLEADVSVNGSVVTLFVNHFKSMMGGRAETRGRRVIQSTAVKKLITERFGSSPGKHPFLVLGDFNDYLESDSQGKPGIDALVGWDQVKQVTDRLPADERWTHYYKGGDAYRQLDYVLVSNSLSAKVKKVEIERRGLPKRATRYAGPRFSGVGKDRPKSSDHCPLVVELEI
jgi:endonuclease/exonuclease/phosphatase family metal-dependent hydrolase